jgi:hypothetical protein
MNISHLIKNNPIHWADIFDQVVTNIPQKSNILALPVSCDEMLKSNSVPWYDSHMRARTFDPTADLMRTC